MKLELLEIPNPCSVPWDTMTGDARVRHCLHCHLDVYDLSALSREEAEHLLATRVGLCVTLLKRHDGTVVTQDCAPQRAAAPHACSPTAAAPRMGAMGGEWMNAAPTPPPPPVRLAGAPMPMPTPAVWELTDPRVGRGTLLADLARAIGAAMAPEDAEPRVREVERALELPANWRTAQCQATKCPLWIPGGSNPVAPDFLKPRTELLAVLEPLTRAAFSSDRAEILLREVRRTAFAGSRGGCPHCRAYIGLPVTPPPALPPTPPPPPLKP